MKKYLKNFKGFSLLIILNFYLSSLTAQDNTTKLLVGSWNSSLNANGVTYNINWNILENGQEVYYFTANNQTNKVVGYWSFVNGIIYEKDINGKLSGYGRIEFLNNNKIKVTVIDNGVPQQAGQVRYYIRKNGSNISFTGDERGRCYKCDCKYYVGSSGSIKCKCGHSRSDHHYRNPDQ